MSIRERMKSGTGMCKRHKSETECSRFRFGEFKWEAAQDSKMSVNSGLEGFAISSQGLFSSSCL